MGLRLSMLVEKWGRACAVLCDWVYREKVDCETHKIACWLELCGKIMADIDCMGLEKISCSLDPFFC